MQYLNLKMILTQMKMMKKKKENSILIQMKKKAQILIQTMQKMIVNLQKNYLRLYYLKQKIFKKNRKLQHNQS